jgi:hypothetical protein
MNNLPALSDIQFEKQRRHRAIAFRDHLGVLRMLDLRDGAKRADDTQGAYIYERMAAGRLRAALSAREANWQETPEWAEWRKLTPTGKPEEPGAPHDLTSRIVGILDRKKAQ